MLESAVGDSQREKMVEELTSFEYTAVKIRFMKKLKDDLWGRSMRDEYLKSESA